MKYCNPIMSLHERFHQLGQRLLHIRCSKGQVLEAASVTAHGIRANIHSLLQEENCTTADIGYLGSRLSELRELTRQLNRHHDQREHVKQLVRIRHKLRERILLLAEKNGIAHAEALVLEHPSTEEE